MKKALLLLLALAAAASATAIYRPPPEVEPETPARREPLFRLALSAATMLAVGDWKLHPIDEERTMFGPFVGATLEASRPFGDLFLAVEGRLGLYDAGGVVGLGQGEARIQSARAMSLSALASVGLFLSQGPLRPWVGLGFGVEWIKAHEEIAGVRYDFDKTFPAAFTVSPAVGLEFDLSETLFLPLKACYDFSLNQVEGYGDFSGHGQDLVLAVGLGLKL